jgi:hypothetical protein
MIKDQKLDPALWAGVGEGEWGRLWVSFLEFFRQVDDSASGAFAWVVEGQWPVL